MAAQESEYHKVTDRYRPHSLMSSIKILYMRHDRHNPIIGAFDRPPYPIIMQTPTLYDIVSNIQASDFVLFGFFYASGTPAPL